MPKGAVDAVADNIARGGNVAKAVHNVIKRS